MTTLFTVLIVLFSILMVLDCLLLVLLVLIQLPKKEAGVGLAFGGGATDALFGAGKGNVLTNLTKWCAGIFFVTALILSILNNQVNKSQQSGSELRKQLSKPAATTPSSTAPSSTAPVAPVPKPAATTTNPEVPLQLNTTSNSPAGGPANSATTPAKTTTNPPAAPPK